MPLPRRLPGSALLFTVSTLVVGYCYTFIIPKFISLWQEMEISLPQPCLWMVKIIGLSQVLPGLFFLPSLGGLIWCHREYSRRRRLLESLPPASLEKMRILDARLEVLLLLSLVAGAVLTIVILFLPLADVCPRMEP